MELGLSVNTTKYLFLPVLFSFIHQNYGFGGYCEQVKAMFISVHLDDFVNFSKVSLPGSNLSVKGIAEDSVYPGAFLAVYGNTILRITNDTVTDLFRSDINMTGTADEHFDNPSDIVSVGNHEYLISDTNNHCLKLLTRTDTTIKLTTYAGICGPRQNLSANGSTEDVFTYPRGLHYSNTTKAIYVVSTSQVHTIDKDKKVRKLWSSESSLSAGFLADDHLLVSYMHGVHIVDLKTADTLPIGADNSSGFKNGRFHEARFSNPQGLVVINNMVALVADSDSNKIRLIDFQLNKVTTGCNQAGRLEGRGKRIPECKLSQPWALLWINGRVIVSTKQGIMTANVQVVNNIQIIVLLIVVSTAIIVSGLCLTARYIFYQSRMEKIRLAKKKNKSKGKKNSSASPKVTLVTDRNIETDKP